MKKVNHIEICHIENVRFLFNKVNKIVNIS